MVAPVAHMVPVIPMELLVEVVAELAGPVVEQVVAQELADKDLQVVQADLTILWVVAVVVALVPLDRLITRVVQVDLV